MDTPLPQGEVALMRAVVAQALAVTPKARVPRDAMPGMRSHRAPAMTTTRRREVDEARRWLLSGGKALDLVCSCALLDPDVVAQDARTQITAFDAGRALPTIGLATLLQVRHGHAGRRRGTAQPEIAADSLRRAVSRPHSGSRTGRHGP